MVGATGIVINSSTLDEGSGLRLVYQCCLRVFMNRLLRTRMAGGVGGEGETPSPTRLDRAPPITLLYSNASIVTRPPSIVRIFRS
jgi:hypothetical protein